MSIPFPYSDGFSDHQQTAVTSQPDDRALDQHIVAKEFACNLRALAAADE
jgi:hypothetical protein